MNPNEEIEFLLSYQEIKTNGKTVGVHKFQLLKPIRISSKISKTVGKAINSQDSSESVSLELLLLWQVERKVTMIKLLWFMALEFFLTCLLKFS